MRTFFLLFGVILRLKMLLVRTLPETCEVMNPLLQDELLADQYVNLPNLRYVACHFFVSFVELYPINASFVYSGLVRAQHLEIGGDEAGEAEEAGPEQATSVSVNGELHLEKSKSIQPTEDVEARAKASAVAERDLGLLHP